MNKIIYVVLVAIAAAAYPKNTTSHPIRQIETCVIPHKCIKPTLASLQPCVWPNTCVISK